MERCSPRAAAACAAGLLSLLALLPAAGCTSALAGAMYIIRGTDEPAEFDGLKEQNVVVICRPPADDQYRNIRVPELLAKELSSLLGQRVSKIKIVDHRKVARWTDENDWLEFKEVGKALDADRVVAVDLESFSIYQGPTLYQGNSQVRVQVLDMHAGGEVIFEKRLPSNEYPVNTGVPTSEREEEEFRREYVAILADRIGRCFYPHDSFQKVAGDTDALLR
ncbi:MAG: hypothetical protein K1X74_22335 [Pirellulales bacterium]|nr:hypothetical protein [Pirellulales bacterium]